MSYSLFLSVCTKTNLTLGTTFGGQANGINLAIKKKNKGLKVIHGRGIEEGHTNIIKQKAIPYLQKLAKQYNCKLVYDNQTDG